MRKIGELKGKPIIEGNPNEIKNNQIHAKTEEGGGITLSERKNGSLETISGGNNTSSGNNEILYYKIDRSKFETQIPKLEMSVSNLFYYHPYVFSIINVLVKVEGVKNYCTIAPSYSGSQEFISEDTIFLYEKAIENNNFYAMACYSGYNYVWEQKGQSFTIRVSSGGNTIGDIICNSLFQLEEKPSQEELIMLEEIKKAINSAFIPVSKEEYYNLINTI